MRASAKTALALLLCKRVFDAKILAKSLFCVAVMF